MSFRHFMIVALILVNNCLFSIATDRLSPCLKELEINFFNEKLLNEAFSLYNVMQSQWPLLVQELQERSRAVPDIIQNKTKEMIPNPLDFPLNTEVTRIILINTLYSIFYNVMITNALYVNENDIQKMFSYITQNKKLELDSCFGPEKNND